MVNVASIPQRSPFRYPGGKTWLVPYIRQWLISHGNAPAEFIEPFAGGAIVGLTVAFERLAEHVTLVELDEQVAAVWETIFDDEGGAEWLAQRIADFHFTAQSVEQILSSQPRSLRNRAFQTIIKNRINHGGILATGAGVLRGGENGRGIGSRWYPETLSQRIRAIGEIRQNITFVEGNGLEVMEQNQNRDDAMFFIDPPYTASQKQAGRRLYTYHTLDHGRLFEIVAAISGDFLMSYDYASEVRDLAGQHNFETRYVYMKSTHHVRRRELLIGSDLSWIRHR